jgi:hypothetical protein
MKNFRVIMVLLLFFLAEGVVLSADTPELLKSDALSFTIGNGFIGVNGAANQVWSNGYELELMMGYRFAKNFGFETGAMFGFTGMIDSLKRTVAVSDTYGNDQGTRTTMGGIFVGFPLGLKGYYQMEGTPFIFSLAGGGNFAFESETGMDNIDGYYPRGTMGFGYYWETGVFIGDSDGYGETTKYGIKFRLMENFVNVKDFARDAYGNESRSTANDVRYMIIFDFGLL